MGFRNPALLIALILIVIVLFGSSKLPDVARAVGQSLKILKKDVKDLRTDDTTPASSAPSNNPAPSPGPAAAAGSAAQSQPPSTPAPEPGHQSKTPDVVTPDVVEGDDSKS